MERDFQICISVPLIIKVIDEEDYPELNEEVKNAKKKQTTKEAISIIKKVEELLRGENRQIMNTVGKQVEFLKKFKESDEFFCRVGHSQSNIYFKINLHYFLCKFPILKKSTLTSSYLKSSFKLIRKVCKAIVDKFDEK